MKKSITTYARSPLGLLLALAMLAGVWIFAGLYIATDGTFTARGSFGASCGVMLNLRKQH